MTVADPGMPNRFGRAAAALALVAALAAGCTRLEEVFAPSAPALGEDWPQLLKDIRAFEQSFGFTATPNFARTTDKDEQHPFCGYVSQFYLPYSYEDPAIHWRDAVSEEECREHADGGDVFFGTVEALGEVAMPLTPEIIAATLDRFIYLVIHEDCHDQYDLPYGIEEPLCELISYKAMPAFADRRYARDPVARRAIRRYAEHEGRRAYYTISLYEELEALYARYRSREVAADAVLRERAAIFARAERELARAAGTMNNVGMANDMTYSRHYPFFESVYIALGRDLARTVAFFRHVDKAKPSRAAVMKRHGLDDDASLAFIRAYEAAIVETANKILSSAPASGP